MKASTILYTLALSATSILAHGDESDATPTKAATIVADTNSTTPVQSGIARGSASSTLPRPTTTGAPFKGEAVGRGVEMGVLLGGVLVGLGVWI